MTPGRNRERGKMMMNFGAPWDAYADELPDPPENHEFLEYPQEFQEAVSRRFENGTILGAGADNTQRLLVREASRDCAKRFRDAALNRANTATIGDAVRTDARRRRERRNGGAR